MNRRSFLQALGLAGAVAPVVPSLVSPRPAQEPAVLARSGTVFRAAGDVAAGDLVEYAEGGVIPATGGGPVVVGVALHPARAGEWVTVCVSGAVAVNRG